MIGVRSCTPMQIVLYKLSSLLKSIKFYLVKANSMKKRTLQRRLSQMDFQDIRVNINVEKIRFNFKQNLR
jgi:hypothetical protein